jgi:hypothetical protein
MINTSLSPTTKWNALLKIPDILESALSKDSYNVDLSQIDKLSKIIFDQLLARFTVFPDDLSQLRTLVEQYLLVAIDILNRREAKENGYFGLNSKINPVSIVGLLKNQGGFRDATRTDPELKIEKIPSQIIDTSSISGLFVSNQEVQSYFNDTISNYDDSFSIKLWIGNNRNPMLMLESISYAKRLHNEIILPITTYYKKVRFHNPNHPIRLGKILFGIVSKKTIYEELKGSQASRHLIGQACNFQIDGIDDRQVIKDITEKTIDIEFGTLALTNGIHISLPFYAANDQLVKNMLLWNDVNIPNYINYKFI